MNREETKEIIRIMSRMYPNFHLPERKELGELINLWASLFTEEPFELVAAGLKAFIVSDTKGFAPVPGQIKEKIRLMTHQGERTELEAWELVRKAIAGGRDSFREVWEKLPEDIREIVSPGQLKEWSITDLSQQQVIASNFMRSYRARTKKRQEYESLPSEIKQIMSQAASVLSIEEGKKC